MLRDAKRIIQSKQKSPKPSKFSHALLIENTEDELLWLQRPDNGIWGGLWSLPLQFVERVDGKTGKRQDITKDKPLNVRSNEKVYETEFTTAEQIINEWLEENKIIAESMNNTLLDDAPIKHTLTHFHWYLTPYKLSISTTQITELNDRLGTAEIEFRWLTAQQAEDSLGLPRAMGKILED